MRGSSGDIRGAGCWIGPRDIPVLSPAEVFGEIGGEDVIDRGSFSLRWGRFSTTISGLRLILIFLR